MNMLRFLVFKRIAKRSPKNTRAAVITSFHHVDIRTIEYEIDAMIGEGLIVFVREGKNEIMRISTDARQMFPETIKKIQWELDNEK